MSTETTGLQLQRAVFLRGVSDPSETARITTVFYRPKHLDLRYEEGFVRTGQVSVPLSNVVEMITMLGNSVERREMPAPSEPEDTPVPTVQEPIASEEAKPFRRRGRPRKNSV
jgi:hypothetical protein